jgi:hypothetical protein
MSSVAAVALKQEAGRNSVKTHNLENVKNNGSDGFSVLICARSIRTCQHKNPYETLIIILVRKDRSERF